MFIRRQSIGSIVNKLQVSIEEPLISRFLRTFTESYEDMEVSQLAGLRGGEDSYNCIH
jgi:hypothetical protein